MCLKSATKKYFNMGKQYSLYWFSALHSIDKNWCLTLYRQSEYCFIERPSPYRAVDTFHPGYKNQSVYAIRGTSRSLFSDKYKTYKYSVGRAYNC